MNENQQYYENVLRAENGIINIMIFHKDGTKGVFHCHNADEIQKCINKNRGNGNIYVIPNPLRSDIPHGLKGGDEDVIGLNAIIADCDILGPAHAENNLPKDAKTVKKILKEFPTPTYYIDSGYGLYAVWTFDKTVSMNIHEERQLVSGIYRGFGKAISSAFSKQGYKLDNVFCPSHLFRIPGSLNYKLNTPIECRILEYSGIFYTLNDFRHYFEEPVQHHIPYEVDDRCVGSADRIAEHCPFVRKLQDDPESVTEPEWKAMCDNIVLAEDGQDKFHDWSSLYSGYSYEETEYKINHSLMSKKPCTCKYIHEHLGFECPKEGCGVKAPVVFSLYTKQEQLQHLLENNNFTQADVYDPYVIKLASYAKENAPAEYGKLKLQVKKVGVGLRDFERAVRCESDKYRESDFDIEPTEIVLEGINLHGAMEPKNYRISIENGITVLSYQDGVLNTGCLCHEPMVIKKRLENIDSGQEKFVVSHYRNNRWKEIISPRSVFLNKSKLVGLSDSGLPVSSSNAEGVVKYLTAYEATNSKQIPFIRSINRIGWIDKEFYPCLVNDEIIYEGDDKDSVISSITEHGDYDLWLKTATELRKEPLSRILLAASFASPLLEILKSRVIILHLWYSSKSGKTAGLKFALSVWGDPVKLMGNYNTTAVGLERRAGTLKHLPLGIDELQSLNEKRLSPSLIVYSLGNGYGKTRGAKNGGLQDVPTWRNCIISTGEQPLAPENAMDGVNSRVLELYGPPISNSENGYRIHQVSESNYGFAGKRYIDFIVNTIMSKKDEIQHDYENIRENLKESFDGDPGAHLDNVSVLVLADFYSSICLFGLDKKRAIEESLSLGITILRNAKNLEKEDVVEQAWHFLEGWVASNQKRFCFDSIPCYGTIQSNGAYIICNTLREALENAGFSYTKSIKGFRDRGYIETIIDSNGNERSQHQKKIQGVNVRTILAKINVQQIVDPEDDFLEDIVVSPSQNIAC